MKWRTLQDRFPALLHKELVEQAAKRRTYLIRVLLAMLLYTLVGFQYYDIVATQSDDPFAVLGQGQKVHQNVMMWMSLGVFLFVPPMTCGAIAHEKERDTLSILLVTKMSPWSIVFGKFIGRLVPILSVVLPAMPLLAFAYSLGGISLTYLWSGLLAMLVFTAMMGSLSIMSSSYCGTTFGALVMTYVSSMATMMFCGCCQGPLLFLSLSTPGNEAAVAALAFSFIGCGITVGCLMMARNFVVERAFVATKNPVLEFFKGLDRVFNDMNQITGGIELVKEKSSLPLEKPLAWRELSKKALGTTRYLLRILMTIEIPVMLILAISADNARSGRPEVAAGVLYFVWLIVLLLTIVKSTSLISGERSRQTLDVILTLPMTGAELIHQLFAGTRRLILILSVPFITIYLFEVWWNWDDLFSQYRSNNDYAWTMRFTTAFYFVCSLLSLFILLPMVAWMVSYISLRAKSQLQSIMTSLILMTCWVFAPLLVPLYVKILEIPIFLSPTPLVMWIEYRGDFSQMLMYNRTERVHAYGYAIISLVNLALYGALFAFVRWRCLRMSDYYMGRLSVDRTADGIAVEPPNEQGG